MIDLNAICRRALHLRKIDGWSDAYFQSVDDCNYHLGYTPPRYPVPSLVGFVFYEKDRIGIEDPDDQDWPLVTWSF